MCNDTGKMDYIDCQFTKLTNDTIDNGYKASIKISGAFAGNTKNMSVSNEQLQAIKQILKGGQ